MRVTDTLPHLSCLTSGDRHYIMSANNFLGNPTGMLRLMEVMEMRDCWPEQFIAALEQSELKTLADELRAGYNSLTGLKNPTPPSLSADLRAHVHPAPAMSQPLVIPDNTGLGSAATSAPPETAAGAALSSESAPQTPPVTQVALTPKVTLPNVPGSPQLLVAILPAKTEASAPQQPEENSETEYLNASSGNELITDYKSSLDGQVDHDSEVRPKPELTVVQSAFQRGQIPTLSPLSLNRNCPLVAETAASTLGDSSSTTTSTAPTPFLMQTQNKCPIQDTTHPGDKLVDTTTLQPEKNSDPIATKARENEHHKVPLQQERSWKPTETTPTTMPPISNSGWEDEYFSKPMVLLSFQRSNQSCSVLPPMLEEACSLTTGDLQISAPVQNIQPNARVSSPGAGSGVDRSQIPIASLLPCQEQVRDELGAGCHNEPEENHYEFTSSL